MTTERLLVIDDEPDFATFIRRVGKSLGHTVEVATHASDFKERCASFRPTIIVLDILMPGIDGIELIQWLGRNHATARVVVVSGANLDYIKYAKVIGETHGLAITAFAKPIATSELEKTLSSSPGNSASGIT